ncbi:glycoside hydrolase family 32 protein [Salisediminibacterium beveridgei]|uniref:Sucrose-6-phosphate hydrolase n=1 Tax=Salisediminibacterium beveridgei TaxID=632773 RepID=A0A1D7QR62_9BACI|nr:sucrose-6-phosphate hydrolase [Salisediminibacterium beveridgei]AOM81497.1 Sucrose-6-phosphate hydrolase [Salisediminibacterium beveridgei]
MTETEKNLIQQAEEVARDQRQLVDADPYRQAFHIMPPVGLLNDPNGWIHWQGRYHMFYQWNPFAVTHGAKFWGHVSSTDLVHWMEEPIALAPSEWYEKNGCYSGSAIDRDGELTLMYTGNVKDDEGNRFSYQCTAVSRDGVHFKKQGPVIDSLPKGYTAHFRDPKVWEEDGVCYMVIGAQTLKEEGRVLLYRSENFRDWSLVGPLIGSQQEPLGDFGYMWECPDVFRLDGQDILIASPQGLASDGTNYLNRFQAGYFPGTLNLSEGIFTPGAFTELDKGFEFYAPQTTESADGRRIMVGWMGVPEQAEDRHPTLEHSWIHCLTLPRELTWVNGKLFQRPVQELEKLRTGNPIRHTGVTRSIAPFELEGIEGRTLEVQLSGVDLQAHDYLDINLHNETVLKLSMMEACDITLERTVIGGDAREQRYGSVDQVAEIRIFLDRSSVEIFINDGELVFSSRHFADPKNQAVTFAGDWLSEPVIEAWKLKDTR